MGECLPSRRRALVPRSARRPRRFGVSSRAAATACGSTGSTARSLAAAPLASLSCSQALCTSRAWRAAAACRERQPSAAELWMTSRSASVCFDAVFLPSSAANGRDDGLGDLVFGGATRVLQTTRGEASHRRRALGWRLETFPPFLSNVRVQSSRAATVGVDSAIPTHRDDA